MPTYLDLYKNLKFLLNLISMSPLHPEGFSEKFYKKSQEAEALDSTGFTSLYCLEKEWVSFVDNHKIGLKTILEDSESYSAFLNQCEAVNLQFIHPSYLCGKDGFHTSLTQTLVYLSVKQQVIGEVTVDDALQLRYNALSEFSKLKVKRFASGEKATGPIQYITEMNVFLDMSSLLHHVAALPNSISMNLVRDKISRPYFVVVLKDGQNITALYDGRGDKPSTTSFPYFWLLQNELNDDSTSVQLTSLPFDKLLWVSLIFELTRQNYFYQHVELPLSFTARMAVNKAALVSSSSIFLPAIPQGDIFPEITLDDVHYSNFKMDGFVQPVGLNWIEDYFKSYVPIEALNFIDEKSDCFKLDEMDLNLKKNPEPYKENGIILSEPYIELSHLTFADFGSHEELLQQRLRLARSNYVKIINYHAKNYMIKESGSAKKWITELLKDEKIQKNIFDQVIPLMGLFDINDRIVNKAPDVCDGFDLARNMFVGHMRHQGVSNLYGNRKVFVMGGNQSKCVLTGSASSYGVVFNIDHHSELERLFNIKNEALPHLLQNYNFTVESKSDIVPDNVYTVSYNNQLPLNTGISIVIPLSKRSIASLQKSIT